MMRCVAFLAFVALSPVTLELAAREHLVIDIWPGQVPGNNSGIGAEKFLDQKAKEKPVKRLTNVTNPTLTVFRPAQDKHTGVAVMIPCWNDGETLPDTIASVRGQDCELVVVDDGSTDPATLEVLDGLRREGVNVLRVPNGGVALFDSFYRSGAFVFGGGHVVLPLLQNEVVPPGWVTEEQFLAGYGAAQAVPGPLFTFAAYLGATIAPFPAYNDPLALGGDLFAVWPPNGTAGAAIALAAIFLPAFLVVFAALPSWGALRARPWAQSALAGVNAGVVGLLLAALIGLAMSAIASLR